MYLRSFLNLKSFRSLCSFLNLKSLYPNPLLSFQHPYLITLLLHCWATDLTMWQTHRPFSHTAREWLKTTKTGKPPSMEKPLTHLIRKKNFWMSVMHAKGKWLRNVAEWRMRFLIWLQQCVPTMKPLNSAELSSPLMIEYKSFYILDQVNN